MSKILLIFSFLLFSFLGFSQEIKNVVATVDGKRVIVSYDLSASSGEDFFVTLKFSKNGGATYSEPLRYVSGDVNQGVLPGVQKKIIWDLEKEIGRIDADVVFKVEADSKKKLPTSVNHKYGVIDFTDVYKENNELIVKFKFIQNTTRELDNFRLYGGNYLITPNGEQFFLASGKFGQEGYNGNSTGYQICAKGVPVDVELHFSLSDNSIGIVSSLCVSLNNDSVIIKNIIVN